MNPPDETFLLDSYRFLWKEEGVEVLIDRLHEEKDGLKCEMSVSTSRQPIAGLVREGRFNLSSAPTRASWVKALQERMPEDRFEVDWYAVFELVCARSIRRWRQGEPIIDLADVEVSVELPYILYPLVVDGASTVLFADGGAGKSLIALACCVSIATGIEIVPGMEPQRLGPSIYWDWEWDAESHAERLQAICAGAGIDPPHGLIYYQREVTSLLEAAPRMRKRVAETGAVFSVADSLGFARGGDANSQDLTTRSFLALRTLSIPTLVLDHVAKNDDKQESSFGSVYTRNSARLMWRLDAAKEGGEGHFYVGLTNTKYNRKGQKPRGLKVNVETDSDERLLSVTFEATDISSIPGLAKAASLKDQISGVIRANSGQPMTPKDIVLTLEAEGSNVGEAVVRAMLNKYKHSFVRVGKGWALLAAESMSHAP